MNTYTYTALSAFAFTCDACGALVINKHVHDDWHEGGGK